jgi:hypothetical protein
LDLDHRRLGIPMLGRKFRFESMVARSSTSLVRASFHLFEHSFTVRAPKRAPKSFYFAFSKVEDYESVLSPSTAS